jgi:hypothetical protein
MKTNEIKSVSAAHGKMNIVHAAGATVEGCTAAYYALCGDTRAIRRSMRGFLEVYVPVNCPSCLAKLAK